MKTFAIIAAVAMFINFISTLCARSENQSGNGVYYGSAAEAVSANWEEYDRENGEDAYINGY